MYVTMSEDVDGLVVEVEQAAHAASPALQRPVAGQHVGVELQVLRHVAPVQQLPARRAAGAGPRLRRRADIHHFSFTLLIITDTL